MFERYGFKVLNRAEITKYKAFFPNRSTSAPSSRILRLPTRFPLTLALANNAREKQYPLCTGSIANGGIPTFTSKKKGIGQT